MPSTLFDNQTIDASTPANEGLLDALSGTPGAGDTIIVAANNLYTAAGRQAIGAAVALFSVQPTHRKEMTGVTVDATTGLVLIQGGGQYVMASLGSKGTWLRTRVALTDGAAKLTLSDLTLPTVDMVSGLCILGSDADLENLYQRGGEIVLGSGAAAATLMDISGTGVARLRRDATTVALNDRGRAILDDSSVVLAAITMKSEQCRCDVERAGTITAIGAAAGGAMGVVDFSRAQFPIIVTTIYESEKLTVRLPAAYPDIVTFGTKNTANGHAKYEYV